MTKEEFESLEVGSVVYFIGDSKFEIVEKRVNGYDNFDIMLSCKSLKDNSDLYFLYNYFQFYMTANPDLKNWSIFKISELNIFWSNNQEQNSIEHFKKKVDETKSELVRLETTLKGLEDSKRMKELTETLSNLIVGDFYTIVLNRGTFTKEYKGKSTNNQNVLSFDNGEFASLDYISISEIEKIIHRPELTKKYDEFKKLQYVCNKNTKDN